MVMEKQDSNRVWRKRYSLIETQIALIFLAQGTNDTKARAICELFSSNQFVNPSPIGINKNNPQQPVEEDNEDVLARS